jgi:hypothetical protein
VTVTLTMTYLTTDAVVVNHYPNAAEARREVQRRAGEYNRKIKGSGNIGQLVDYLGTPRAVYTITEVTE